MLDYKKNPLPKIMLAPLAGVTDSSFRRICKKMGAQLVFTEMVSAKALYYKDRKTDLLLKTYSDEEPISLQIFGSEIDIMVEAVKYLSDRDFYSLDINMGCPVPKVVKNGDGSALLKNMKHAHSMVKRMVETMNGVKNPRPISIKMRLGFDDSSAIVEFAQAMEDAGAGFITVHGRTREQYYLGEADWEAISDVKRNVKIPVVGNGDIYTAYDAIKMLKVTGCDSIMVARGSMGNPWIFAQIDAALKHIGDDEVEQIINQLIPTRREKADMILRQLEMCVSEKGEYTAIREMRKHICWYLKGERGHKVINDKVNHAQNIAAVVSIIKEFLC